MDVFAHVLWTNAAYSKKYWTDRKSRYWAAFFGVVPDVVSFAPLWFYIPYLLLTGKRVSFMVMMDPFQAWPVLWAQFSYQYTHSLLVFAASLVVLLALRRGKMYWPFLGWALHIVIDIFTHPDFYRTPFLFPLSEFKNRYAVSWAEPHFMAANYGALVLAYILIYAIRSKTRKNSA